MLIDKGDYSIEITDDFNNELFLFEMESKGYLTNTLFKMKNGHSYKLEFYDIVRLKQDAESELLEGMPCFYQENIIIVDSLNKKAILNAIEFVWKKKIFLRMVKQTED